MVRGEDYQDLTALFGNKFGVALRVIDERGLNAADRLDNLREEHPPLHCMRPEERRPWEALSKASSQIRSHADLGVVWLNKGQTVESPPSAYQSGFEQYCERKPPPKPRGQFSEVPQVRTLPPGRYSLRASYDMKMEPGKAESPGFVAFELPPLAFEVRP